MTKKQTPEPTETEKVENLYGAIDKSLVTLLNISPDDDKKGIEAEELACNLVALAQIEVLISLRDVLNKLIGEQP